MSKTKYLHNVALPIAQSLARRIANTCERVSIAGSLRRGCEMVGDIELLALKPKTRSVEQANIFGGVATVASTNLLSECIDDLEGWELGRKNGDRFKQLVHASGITCDLWIVHDRRSWGWQKVLRTGPEEFGMELVKVAHKRNKHFADGYLHGHPRKNLGWLGHAQYVRCDLGDACGRIIATPDEQSVFDALEIPYMPVKSRTPDGLRRIYRMSMSND